MIDKIPDILKVKVDIKLKSEKPAILNSWTSSSLRGALSNRLMHRYCKLKDNDCSKCSNFKTCTVSVLFNAEKHQDNRMVSNPIIINSFCKENTISDTIDMQLVLFGKGIMFLQHIILELVEGIYINSAGEKVLFKLEDIKYTDSDERVLDNGILCSLHTSGVKDMNVGNKLIVDFKTPVRLKESFIKLEFKEFMRAVLIRLKSVYNTAGVNYEIPYNELLESCADIKLEKRNIHYKNVIRASKSNGKNEVPALIGNLVYSGNFDKFIPYILLAQDFNIGKWCTMGLGNFTISNGGNSSEV